MRKFVLVGASGVIGKNLLESQWGRDFYIFESNYWELDSEIKNTTVIYLRAVSSPTFVHNNPEYSESVNVSKSALLIQAFLNQNNRVIFASSDVVYGETGSVAVDEAAAVQPYGLYAEQKHRIEDHFKNYPEFISLRLSIIFGKYCKIRKLLNEEAGAAIPDPVIRNPVHVQDVISVIQHISYSTNWDSLVDRSQNINVGGPDSISVFDLAAAEAKRINSQAPIRTKRHAQDMLARPAQVRMLSNLAETLTNKSFVSPYSTRLEF